MAEAEAWGSTHGWTTDRHIAFPTVDVPIANLPKLQQLWKERLLAQNQRISEHMVLRFFVAAFTHGRGTLDGR